MKSAAQLRDQWSKNQILRAEWDAVLQSPAWEAVSALVAAEMLEEAQVHQRHEADPVLARNLSALKGGMAALRRLQEAIDPDAPPPAPEIPEYSDEYLKKLQKQKQEL
jgi:hypothetical protein